MTDKLSQDELKRAVARAAVQHIAPCLGTGPTRLTQVHHGAEVLRRGEDGDVEHRLVDVVEPTRFR